MTADIVAGKFRDIVERETGGKRLGDIDAALGSDRLDSRGPADMGAEVIFDFQHRIARPVDRPVVAAQPERQRIRQSVIIGEVMRHRQLHRHGAACGDLHLLEDDKDAVAPGIAKDHGLAERIDDVGETAKDLVDEDG